MVHKAKSFFLFFFFSVLFTDLSFRSKAANTYIEILRYHKIVQKGASRVRGCCHEMFILERILGIFASHQHNKNLLERREALVYLLRINVLIECVGEYVMQVTINIVIKKLHTKHFVDWHKYPFRPP